jgi:hypothetical protein
MLKSGQCFQTVSLDQKNTFILTQNLPKKNWNYYYTKISWTIGRSYGSSCAMSNNTGGYVRVSESDLTIEYPERYCGFTRSIQENSGIEPRLGYELLTLSNSLFMNYFNILRYLIFVTDSVVEQITRLRRPICFLFILVLSTAALQQRTPASHMPTVCTTNKDVK